MVTQYKTTATQAPITKNETRIIGQLRYTYRESWTHGLIIEHPSSYSLDTDKYSPYDPELRTAWKNILDQHIKDFVQSWLISRQQQKLYRKVIRELTRKIKDIEYYMTESLKDLNKAKRRREKKSTTMSTGCQRQQTR